MERYTLIDSVVIDSKDRISGTSTNCRINIPRSSISCNGIRVKKVEIPASYENIVTGYNTFEINGVTYTVPVGTYVYIDDLVSGMNALLPANFRFKLEYNSRLTVYETASVVFTFKPLTLNTTLGFTQATYTLAATYTAEYAFNILYGKYFTIHSSILSDGTNKKKKHTDGRPDMLFQIPIPSDISYQTLITYTPTLDEAWVENVDKKDYSVIDLTIYDEYKDILDLSGQTFVVEIERYHL